QLGGNMSFQWALPILGLSLSVPLVFGTLILGGALAGRWFLEEPIAPRTAAAMVLLITAIGVLSWGAEGVSASGEAAGDRPASEPPPATVALAGIAVCCSGFCNAASNVLIRRLGATGLPL